MTYLTEETLGIFLTRLFPDIDIIHNKQVPNSGIKNRPDYRIESMKLVVEFDGYQHFNSQKVQELDRMKYVRYSEMGYKVISIPYFVQLSNETVDFYFSVKTDLEQEYEHGFVSDVCLHPCDFNVGGLQRFIGIMGNLPVTAATDIRNTLTANDVNSLSYFGFT